MHNAVRRTLRWLAPFSLALLCVSNGHAQEQCSNSTIEGGYGFSVTGNNLEAGIQYALTGRFVADGKGRFVGTGSHSISGKGSRFRFTGTYTVEPDCTGTAKFVYPDGTWAPLDIVIVSDGNEIYIIVAGDGSVEFGNAKRQFWRRQKQS